MEDPLSLNIPLQNFDSSRPLLPEGDYEFQIAEATVAPNKDKTGRNLELKFSLTSPATATNGATINPNYPVFNIYPLQAKEGGKDPDFFRRNLCDLLDAVLGTTISDRPALTMDVVNSFVGRKVLVHVYVDEYPENSGVFSNKVKRLKKAS